MAQRFLAWISLLLLMGGVVRAQNVEFDQTSDPVSILSQTTFPLPNTTVSTIAAPSTYQIYTFAYWTVNGVRMTDPSGAATNPATFVITGPAAAVAHYVPTTQDTDGHGLPDSWQLKYFGSLGNDPNSDPVGDGYTLAQDFLFGFSPLVTNTMQLGGVSRRRNVPILNIIGPGVQPLTVTYGGVSRRRSAMVTAVEDTTHYSVLQVSSTPGGVISQASVVPTGTTVNLPVPPDPEGGYRFTGWIVNGVRYDSPTQLQPIPLTVNGNTTAVARYISETDQTPGDGLPDWQEWFYFNAVGYGPNDDPRGTGFTLAQDQIYGMSPVVPNQLVMGGVSRRRSAATTVIVDTADYVQLQQSSSPPGIISQTSAVPKGVPVSLVTAPDPFDGYRFTGWLLNGVRVDQPTQNQPIPITVTQDSSVVARYISETDQTPGDGLPDWQEWLYFNAVGYGPNDDPIGDGFTLAQDQLYGFSPVATNALSMGGVSRRRGVVTAVNAVFLPTPPVIAATTVTNIGSDTALLTAEVNPIGSATTGYFQYGLTAAYNLQTPVQSLGNGLAPTAMSALLEGLQPNTPYHFRVVATNAQGTSVGSDMTFTTLASTAPPTIVNVEAAQYGDFTAGLPSLNFSLPAGNYLLTPVNPQLDARALYTAWDEFSDANTWESELLIGLASSGQAIGSMGVYSHVATPSQAFSNPGNVPVVITLPADDTVEFGVGDQILYDNQGGVSFTIQAITAPQLWRWTYFNTLNNTGLSADTADPYLTGIPNLAVFALLGPNQSPVTAQIGQLPQPQINGGNYVYSFTQPAGATGVIYGAEWSTTLAPGSWQPIPDTGSGNIHTFSVPIGANTQLFLRLTVMEP